jgi:hypothetical protein
MILAFELNVGHQHKIQLCVCKARKNFVKLFDCNVCEGTSDVITRAGSKTIIFGSLRVLAGLGLDGLVGLDEGSNPQNLTLAKIRLQASGSERLGGTRQDPTPAGPARDL